MADNTENIGSVSVSIIGDYSQLASDFDAAVALAVKEGATLAEALNKAYDSINVTPLTEAFVGVGNVAEVAATQLKLFDEAAHVDYADAAGQLNLFATELERMGPAAEQAVAPVAKLPDQIKQVGDSAAKADQQLTDMLGPLLRLSGVSLSVGGLVALGGDALSAFGDLQKADIALTAITGDASQAAASIEGLKSLALDDALSFPNLLTANLRLTEFGVEAGAIPGALGAIADAAAATNRSFDQVATSFERIVESGVVMNRSLVTLGITTQDMADAMGVSIDQVKKVFSELDQTLRAEVVTAALQKLEGTAKQTASGILGQWQTFKTQFLLLLTDIGNGLESSGSGFLSWAGSAISSLDGVVQKINAAFAITRANHLTDLGFEAPETGPTTSKSGGEGPNEGSGEGSGSLTDAQRKAQVALQVAADAAKQSYKEMEDAATSFHNSAVNLWNSLPASYDQYLANLQDGGKTAKSIASEIEADLNRAASVMIGMSGTPLKNMQAWVDGLKDALATMQQFAATDAFYQAAVKINLAMDKFPDQVKELSDLDAGFKEFFQTMADGAANVPDALNKISVEALASKLLEAQKQLDDSGKKLTDTFTKFYDQYEERTRKAIGITDDFKVKFGELATINADLTPGGLAARGLSDDLLAAYQHALDLNKAYKDLGITADDTGQLMSKHIKNLNLVLGDSRATLDVVELAWSKWGGDIAKLAKTDLPAAVDEYEKLLAKLQALGAAQGALNALQEASLKVQINIKDQTGTDATAEIERLTQLQYETKALKDATEGLGEVYVGLRKDFDSAFGQLSKGLADAIVNGKNLGDVFVNVGKQVATSILDTIIKGALLPLQDELNKTGGLFDTLGKAITGSLGKVTKGGFSLPGLGGGSPDAPTWDPTTGGWALGAPGEAGTVSDIAGGAPPISGAVDWATSGGSGASSDLVTGAASSAGGGLGDFGSLLGGGGGGNPIGVIMQMIQGIVQGFQMAHLENLTGEIEVTTRKIEAETGGNGGESIFGYAKLAWQALEVIETQLSNLHDDNVELLGKFDAMLAILAYSGGGGGNGGGGLSAADIFGITDAVSSFRIAVSSLAAVQNPSGPTYSLGPVVQSFQQVSTSADGATVAVTQFSSATTQATTQVVQTAQDYANAVGATVISSQELTKQQVEAAHAVAAGQAQQGLLSSQLAADLVSAHDKLAAGNFALTAQELLALGEGQPETFGLTGQALLDAQAKVAFQANVTSFPVISASAIGPALSGAGSNPYAPNAPLATTGTITPASQTAAINAMGDAAALMKRAADDQLNAALGQLQATGRLSDYASVVTANGVTTYALNPLVVRAMPSAATDPSAYLPSAPPSYAAPSNPFTGGSSGFFPGGGSVPVTVNALNPSSRGVVDGIITGLRQIGVKVA